MIRAILYSAAILTLGLISARGMGASQSYPGYVTCTTESNGLQFSKSERDPNLARSLTTSACTSDNRTNNDECTANLWCSDQGAYPERYACTTQSNGLTFARDGLNQALVQSLTISECTSDNRTNNDECRGNIYCQLENGPSR